MQTLRVVSLTIFVAAAVACESGSPEGQTRDDRPTESSQTSTSANAEESTPKGDVPTGNPAKNYRGLADEPDLELPDAPPVDSRLELSEEEWRERLTDEEFDILRENGTEPRGSGDLLDEKSSGVYVCAGCGAPVFSSNDKYGSGTGWPSFTEPYETGRLGYSRDTSLGMVRVEVHCARCGGHLGHVFDDGPEPNGTRYCINSRALDFERADAPEEDGD